MRVAGNLDRHRIARSREQPGAAKVNACHLYSVYHFAENRGHGWDDVFAGFERGDGQPGVLQEVLRDFQQFAVFERRLVGDDAADRHVKRLSDVNKGFAIE